MYQAWGATRRHCRGTWHPRATPAEREAIQTPGSIASQTSTRPIAGGRRVFTVPSVRERDSWPAWVTGRRRLTPFTDVESAGGQEVAVGDAWVTKQLDSRENRPQAFEHEKGSQDLGNPQGLIDERRPLPSREGSQMC